MWGQPQLDSEHKQGDGKSQQIIVSFNKQQQTKVNHGNLR